MNKRRQKEDLLNEIEELRERLNSLLETEISTSSSILTLSEHLDKLILEFYTMGYEGEKQRE